MSTNHKFIGGQHFERRFAYLSKTKTPRFGLLLASCSRDAREHLGRGFFIRQTWLGSEEVLDICTSRRRRWEIVSSIFLDPKSEGYIGDTRAELLKERGCGVS
jgi:hypothetical protein